MKSAITLAALLLALIGLGSVARADGGTLRIQVTGFRNAKGDLLCALFANGSEFPGDGAMARIKSVPSMAGAECVFGNVPMGRYAVAVVHDENGNGKLDRVPLIGLPLEGYGVTNNKTYATHAPRFEESAFAFDGNGELVLTVHLRN